MTKPVFILALFYLGKTDLKSDVFQEVGKGGPQKSTDILYHYGARLCFTDSPYDLGK